MVSDHFADQVRDLVKCRNPKIKFNGDLSQYESYVHSYLNGRSFDEIGRLPVEQPPGARSRQRRIC